MERHSWLTGIYQRISQSVRDKEIRRRRRPIRHWDVCVVECLESRRVLSPLVTGTSVTATNFTEGGSPVAITPNLAINSTDLTGATIQFTNFQAEDRISFLNTYALQHTFVQDPINHTATLTLIGNNT